MCLDTLDEKITRPVRFGYVAAFKGRGKYRRWCGGEYKYQTGRWHRSGTKINIFPGYVLGFHVWTSKRAAIQWRGGFKEFSILLVETREPLATGKQRGNRVTVCRYRKIIKEVK